MEGVDMLPGMELMGCQELAVPVEVMHHVVGVESSHNPYAIGVVGARLARQPDTLDEAVSTARMLEKRGYNFSLGLAQVNRHNLAKYGLHSYEAAFAACPNVVAGSRILAECVTRAGGDWGKAFSCYYSGNFVTGYRHGYVQKVMASMQGTADVAGVAAPIEVHPSRRPDIRPEALLRADPVASRRRVEAMQDDANIERTPVSGTGQPAPRGAASDGTTDERPASTMPPAAQREGAPSAPGRFLAAEDQAFVF